MLDLPRHGPPPPMAATSKQDARCRRETCEGEGRGGGDPCLPPTLLHQGRPGAAIIDRPYMQGSLQRLPIGGGRDRGTVSGRVHPPREHRAMADGGEEHFPCFPLQFSVLPRRVVRQRSSFVMKFPAGARSWSCDEVTRQRAGRCREVGQRRRRWIVAPIPTASNLQVPQKGHSPRLQPSSSIPL